MNKLTLTSQQKSLQWLRNPTVEFSRIKSVTLLWDDNYTKPINNSCRSWSWGDFKKRLATSRKLPTHIIQDCIPVGCVPPARWPYLPACSALGGPGPGGVSGLGVSGWGGAWSGGGVCLVQGVCLVRGCLVWGGVWSGGVPAPGGVCLVRGGLVWGGGIPACTEADPPPVNRITHACENITLPQLRCGR